jgi:hypothetical protein
MANTQEDFDAWEGWVNSRMRLLIKARLLAGAACWTMLLDALRGSAWSLHCLNALGMAYFGEIAHGMLAPRTGLYLFLACRARA